MSFSPPRPVSARSKRRQGQERIFSILIQNGRKKSALPAGRKLPGLELPEKIGVSNWPKDFGGQSRKLSRNSILRQP